MVELALDSHYHILIDSFHMKDHERRVYINKCVEDIKKVWHVQSSAFAFFMATAAVVHKIVCWGAKEKPLVLFFLFTQERHPIPMYEI